jgi:hypothetical protein
MQDAFVRFRQPDKTGIAITLGECFPDFTTAVNTIDLMGEMQMYFMTDQFIHKDFLISKREEIPDLLIGAGPFRPHLFYQSLCLHMCCIDDQI